MNRLLAGVLYLLFGLFSSSLIAAPGEWWEISVKMEMEGMPFAMPGQSHKVCMPKGGQSDPSQTQGKDKNCKMTDVKHSGNTVKFKGTCVDKGETMHMAGETSHDANSFKSNVKMTGKSHGENVDMKMVSNGKRVGGACDTEEMGKKMQAQAESQNREMKKQMCNTSKYDTSSWVASSQLFVGKNAACPEKKETLCKVLRTELPNDPKAYHEMVGHEKLDGVPSAAKACNLNMASIKTSLCKSRARKGPLSFLEEYCPAEAKTFRELARKRAECEERGFTGVNYKSLMKKCMGGEVIEEDKPESASPAKSRKSKPESEQDNSSSSDSNSDSVIDGAKKLKGLFGF